MSDLNNLDALDDLELCYDIIINSYLCFWGGPLGKEIVIFFPLSAEKTLPNQFVRSSTTNKINS